VDDPDGREIGRTPAERLSFERVAGPTGAIWGRRRFRLRQAVALAGLAVVALAGLARARALGTDTHGARIVHFTINSRLVHRSLALTAVIPGGRSAGPRPLVVFLHGKGDNQDSNVDEALFTALARLGPRAPVIVFPYGGADSYWHDRAGAAWGSYVVREVIPQAVSRLQADPTQIAIGGISMGGFGALDLARLNPRRFCAVGAHSAALWLTAGESAPGAFDDAEDFARHNVIAAARAADAYRGTPVWIDVGTQDPFRAADTALARTLRAHRDAVELHVSPGAHDHDYWQRNWGRYLDFYASRC
jgi:S-formylglutathione hydrolase FrmB